ncbi:MAG: hypothetical protein QXN56_03260, partial [Candidatus Hadarchaeum sp.]
STSATKAAQAAASWSGCTRRQPRRRRRERVRSERESIALARRLAASKAGGQNAQNRLASRGLTKKVCD